MIGVAFVLLMGVAFGFGIGRLVRRWRLSRLPAGCPFPCLDPTAERAPGVACIFPLACTYDRKEQSCAKS